MNKLQVLSLSKLCVSAGFIWVTMANLLNGATYYVAPDGNDNNSGTSLNTPFATLTKAYETIQGGDTIYLREGVHNLPKTFRITAKSGTSANPTRLFAYPGETPILDGDTFTEFDPDLRDNRIILLQASYWHLKGLVLRNAPTRSSGIEINSNGAIGNILEELVAYGNENTGIALSVGATDTLVLNCDSYENFDIDNAGQDADGFSAKFSVGTGNRFIGCRAWSNSDDGWDLWMAGNPVIIENSWAYLNGIDIWDFGPAFEGNGNGFKFGRGEGAHIIDRCLAWSNGLRGFDNNNNITGVTLRNCTAWNNSANYRFDEIIAPNRIYNSISYQGQQNFSSSTDHQNNSWNLPVTVNNTDFQSLDDTIARSQRGANGSLPNSGFLKLVRGSDLIDKGIDLGLGHTGSLPDLGAYERVTAPAGKVEAEAMDLSRYDIENRSEASGSNVVKGRSGINTALYTFTGATGSYNIDVVYLDEADGAGSMSLFINDVSRDTWILSANDSSYNTRTIPDLFINSGDEIKIAGTLNLGEHVRIDSVDVKNTAQSGIGSVLLIIADDLGRDSLALFNDDPNASLPPTPNIDNLASQGITFNRMYAYSSCSPTRASILTGRYGFRTGVLSPETNTLQSNEFTLAEAIVSSGAIENRLAQLGKWHLGSALDAPNTVGGWPHFAGALSGAVPNYESWAKVTNGVRTNRYTVYATSDLVNDAVDWIDDQGANDWFLWVAFNAPHTPLHKPDNDLHDYDDLDGTATDIENNPRPYYEAMVQAMDTEIGRLLQSVDLASTTVIFIGDNGTPNRVLQPPFPNSHGKGSLYEGGVNIPMIITGAAVSENQKNTTSESILHSVDLYRTILDLLDIDQNNLLPPELVYDSLSFHPLLTGIDPEYSRPYTYTDQPSNTNRQFMIANQRYKWIQNDDGSQEFYDLFDGLEESNNRINNLGSEAQLALSGFQNELSVLENIPTIHQVYVDGSGDFNIDLGWFANANFRVEFTDDLIEGVWQEVTDFTLSDNGDPTLTITHNSPGPLGFYQVSSE